MKTYRKTDLERYLEKDWILEMVKDNTAENEKNLRVNQWFFEMDNKRMIYADVYGDILKKENKGISVLDVGGGVSAFTKVLADNCNYTLLDFCAHGGKEYLDTLKGKHNLECITEDWYNCDFSDKKYDIVIANDIFPDTDQRLELFIDRMLPICKELRIVLTYYNNPRFYLTKRVDDTEMLTFLSWDGEITSLKLEKYIDRIRETSSEELNSMKYETDSVYRNGRQVSYIVLEGDLK